MKLTHFDKQQEQSLRRRLAQLQRNEAVLDYAQLQGLLFALACSPETIRPAEWFDLIWLNDEPQFDNEEEARSFYRQVVALSEHISEMAKQHRFLPFSARYSEHWQPELSQWCEGLLLGHQYLEDLWLIAIDDLNDHTICENVDTALSLAATFADIVDTRQLGFEEAMELSDDHLPEAYDLFRKVLDTYASVASVWAQGVWDVDAEQLFLALEPVAHDKLCPCGSGEIFSRCCLH